MSLIFADIPGNRVHYLDNAIEAEADAICDGENHRIMEHIEPCGTW